jgi:hypothetical protein
LASALEQYGSTEPPPVVLDSTEEEKMDAPRTTRRAVAEWFAAAGILVGLLLVVSTIVRDAGAVSPIMPVSAREATLPAPTASIPERAISVPLLLLPDGIVIHVGDADRDVRMQLGATFDVSPIAIERGIRGERQTRILEYRNVRFALVVEPFEQDMQPRVAAIYLR